MGRLTLLWRLAARDFRRHPVEGVMVFLVITAAATTLTVSFALSGVTNNPYQQTRSATTGPDVIADVVNTSGLAGQSTTPPSQGSLNASQVSATVSALTAAPEVTAHSGPFPYVYSTIRFGSHAVDVMAEGRDQAQALVDQPQITQGGWVRSAGVVVERGFADALGAHVGDEVSIGDRPLRVVGIAVTAAVPAYPSSLCHLACVIASPGPGVPNMGFVWVTPSSLEALATGNGPVSYLLNLKLGKPGEAVAFVAAHTVPGPTPVLLFTWQSIRGEDNALIQIEQVALQLGGWLLGLLTLAGLAVLVGRRVTEPTRRVGLLKAVGATPATVAAVLLIGNIALAAVSAAVGLLAGWSIAPVLTSSGSGLVGSPGAPSIRASTVAIVAIVAVCVAATASFVPAVRAARINTVSALADTARAPSRRPRVIALSAHLPIPALLALRQLARRPRRALLNAFSVAVTVTGIVAILASYAHTSHANSAIDNLKIDRLHEVTTIITVMLMILAAINTTFIAWATAADARLPSAIERAIGATVGQVTIGLSMISLLPALPAALVGVPLGLEVYHLLATGQTVTVPPTWQLAAVVLSTLLVVTLLTAIPSRLGSRRSPAELLQST